MSSLAKRIPGVILLELKLCSIISDKLEVVFALFVVPAKSSSEGGLRGGRREIGISPALSQFGSEDMQWLFPFGRITMSARRYKVFDFVGTVEPFRDNMIPSRRFLSAVHAAVFQVVSADSDALLNWLQDTPEPNP